MTSKWLSRVQKLNRPLVLGMVHVGALPGTPLNKDNLETICNKAVNEARVYEEYKLDGVVVENMHDVPYVRSKSSGPEIVACMTRICAEIKKQRKTEMLFGVQILAGCNKEALAVALASGFDFVRVEGFVFAHVADEGFTDACAGELLRFRKALQAEHIALLTDIKKKHSSHSITADVNLVETANAAEFFLSDGVIVTGTATGHAPNKELVIAVKQHVNVPVVVGSGVTDGNLHQFKGVHAVIVGSFFKKDGKWNNELDTARIRNFMIKIQEHSHDAEFNQHST